MEVKPFTKRAENHEARRGDRLNELEDDNLFDLRERGEGEK